MNNINTDKLLEEIRNVSILSIGLDHIEFIVVPDESTEYDVMVSDDSIRVIRSIKIKNSIYKKALEVNPNFNKIFKVIMET